MATCATIRPSYARVSGTAERYVREWLLNRIPTRLRFAMGAGVGLFLGLIGLKTAGIVVDSDAKLDSGKVSAQLVGQIDGAELKRWKTAPDSTEARAAFQVALKVNPHLEGIRELLDDLDPQLLMLH